MQASSVALTVLLSYLAVSAASDQAAGAGVSGQSTNSRVYTIPTAIVSIQEEAKVSSRDQGILMELSVKEGNQVQAGQNIGHLTRDEAAKKLLATEKELEVARMEANNEVRVSAAKASAKVADAKFNRAAEIRRRKSGAVTLTEFEELRLSADHAKLQIQLADHEFKIAKITAQSKEVQRDLAGILLDRRDIKAPIAGEVVELFYNKGEWVELGRPVLHIINMKRLQIDGFVNAKEFAPRDIEGCEVRLYLYRRGKGKQTVGPMRSDRSSADLIDDDVTGLQPYTQPGGKPIVITYAKNIIEPNEQFRVTAEVENTPIAGPGGATEWMLIPGTMVRMEILVK